MYNQFIRELKDERKIGLEKFKNIDKQSINEFIKRKEKEKLMLV